MYCAATAAMIDTASPSRDCRGEYKAASFMPFHHDPDPFILVILIVQST